MVKKVIILVGKPASGKTDYAMSKRFQGYDYISPSTLGASNQILKKIRESIYRHASIILDDRCPTILSRKIYIDIFKTIGKDYVVDCHYISTSDEQCKKNGEERNKNGGKRYNSIELHKFNNNFETPKLKEGFNVVSTILFPRSSKYKNPAIIMAIDNVVRFTLGKYSYPTDVEQIHIYKNVSAILKSYIVKGYKLFLFTHQPEIEQKKILSEDKFHDCLFHTVKSIDAEIEEVVFCPHQSASKCKCYPPSSGLLESLKSKHKLDLENSILVGLDIVDQQMAENAGVGKFVHREIFFQEQI